MRPCLINRLIYPLQYNEFFLGICDLCMDSGKDLLVFPAHRVGSVQLLTVSAAALSHVVSTAPVTVAAHKNPVAIVALDSAGSYVATASTKVRDLK